MTARLRSLGILATEGGGVNKPYVARGRSQLTGFTLANRGGASGLHPASGSGS